MLVEISLIASLLSLILVVSTRNELKKEKRRNKIAQSFIAGIIRSISDYSSKTDCESAPAVNKKLPIKYSKLLDSVEYEFLKDFWTEPFNSWIKADRLIFSDNKYGDDGFNFIYWDLHDDLSSKFTDNK